MKTIKFKEFMVPVAVNTGKPPLLIPVFKRTLWPGTYFQGCKACILKNIIN